MFIGGLGRMRLSRHCYRHTEEIASKIIVMGTPRWSYKKRYTSNIIHFTCRHRRYHTGACNTNELAKMMNDRDDWKKRVIEVKRLKRQPIYYAASMLSLNSMYFIL